MISSSQWLLSAALFLAPVLACAQEVPAVSATPGDTPPANAKPVDHAAAPATGVRKKKAPPAPGKAAPTIEILGLKKGQTGNNAYADFDGPFNFLGIRLTTPNGGRWNIPERRAQVFGDAILDTSKNFRILAREFSLAVPASGPEISTEFFRFGSPPGYIQGGSFLTTRVDIEAPPVPPTEENATATGTPAAVPVAKDKEAASLDGNLSITEATLKDVTIHYQEPDFFSISVDAGKVVLTNKTPTELLQRRSSAPSTSSAPAAPAATSHRPDNKQVTQDALDNTTLHVEDAIVRVAGIPVFYLPSYTQHGLDLPPFRPIVRAGQKDNIGTFLRTTVYYTGFGRGIEPGLLLDGYAKAGVLVGPALNYDTSRPYELKTLRAALENAPAKGTFQSAWIHDDSHRGTDNYGRAIDAQRGFLLWNHKQTFQSAAALELTAALNYWSDTSVLRDFRSEEFHENQRPDNFVELVLPKDGYYLSAFTRFRPNDFYNIQQRLPEIRLDMPASEIARTGVYHHLNASFAFLYERSSLEYAFSGGDIESPRFDVYYGLTRPLKVEDWFSFTPVAGVRSTTYFNPLETGGTNQSDPYTRVLPQLGFDLHLLLSGRWEYKNPFWEINGLRHLARPIAQYRWIPAADKGADRIPAVDRYAFIPLPSPIDLEQKRYADDLWEQQVLRLGLENIFQTRDEEYGSRDLLWLNFYQDFRDTDRPGERARSTFYTQLGLAPARWLGINFFNRVDTYTLYSKEVSAQLDIHDGDRWRLWFGAQYTTDIAETNQYYWGVEYHLNSNYSLRGQWRFDSESSRLTEQYYGLRQRLGNTWTLEYHFSHRRDARRDNGFNFGASLRLTAF